MFPGEYKYGEGESHKGASVPGYSEPVFTWETRLAYSQKVRLILE